MAAKPSEHKEIGWTNLPRGEGAGSAMGAVFIKNNVRW
jgi:hypothetical protein